jgi:lysozyme family protein
MTVSLDELATAGMWVTTVETGILTRDPALSRWGISLKYHPELGVDGITGMTQPRAAAILTSPTYWLPSWSGLPAYLATPMLAFSVLEGPTQAAYALQRALGVKVDGDIGPATCAAAMTANPSDPLSGLLRRNYEAQWRRLAESPRWSIDGAGWCGRQAAAMAAGAVVAAQAARPA